MEVPNTSLKNLIAARADGQKTNRGFILGGSFGDYSTRYWEVDNAQLVVQWED